MPISKTVSYTFDPFKTAGVTPKNISASKRREILREVGDFVVESILNDVAQGRSPVAGGGKFKKLNKKYKAFKDDEGLPPEPNLEFTGDMLDSLTFDLIDGKIRVGVDESQEEKAANHNNFKDFGTPTLPKRQFIPRGNGFKGDINKGIRDVILNMLEDEDA